jgi:hypothetical protein
VYFQVKSKPVRLNEPASTRGTQSKPKTSSAAKV